MDEYERRDGARGELGQLLESMTEAGDGELPEPEIQRDTFEERREELHAFRGEAAPSSPSTAAPSRSTNEGHSETDSPSTDWIEYQRSWSSRQQDSAAYRDWLRRTYAGAKLDAAIAAFGGIVKERIETLVLQILLECLARETYNLNLVVVDGQSVLNSSRIVKAVDILSAFRAANPGAFVVVFHRDRIGGRRGGSSEEDVVAHDQIGAIVFARARFTTRQRRLAESTTECASNADEDYHHQRCRCDDLMMHWFLVLAVQYGVPWRRITAVSNNSCYNTRSHDFQTKWAPEDMRRIPSFSVSICCNGRPFRDDAIRQTPFQWVFPGDELAPLQAAVRFSRTDKTYDVGASAHCVEVAMSAIQSRPVARDSWMYLTAQEVEGSGYAVW
jgi:hypothetical protein